MRRRSRSSLTGEFERRACASESAIAIIESCAAGREEKACLKDSGLTYVLRRFEKEFDGVKDVFELQV